MGLDPCAEARPELARSRSLVGSGTQTLSLFFSRQGRVRGGERAEGGARELTRREVGCWCARVLPPPAPPLALRVPVAPLRAASARLPPTHAQGMPEPLTAVERLRRLAEHEAGDEPSPAAPAPRLDDLRRLRVALRAERAVLAPLVAACRPLGLRWLSRRTGLGESTLRSVASSSVARSCASVPALPDPATVALCVRSARRYAALLGARRALVAALRSDAASLRSLGLGWRATGARLGSRRAEPHEARDLLRAPRRRCACPPGFGATREMAH